MLSGNMWHIIFDMLFNLWNVIFEICFLSAAILYYLYFQKPLKNKQKIIRNALSNLTGLNSNSVVTTYEKLKNELYNNAVLTEAWKKYEKTLIKPGNEEAAVIRSTVDADTYFNVPGFTLDLSINFWQNLAGIFTGLGILGTFVGITVGLVGMDTSTNATLQKGISGLLDGTKTAFITSVIGIVCAIIFNWYHNTRLMRKFAQDVNNLSNALDQLFPRTSIEIILCDSLNEYKEQTETLKAFSTDLAISIGDALDNTIQGEFKPVFTELLAAIKELNSGGVNTIATSINDNVGEALKNFASTLNKLRETMQTSMENSQRISQENGNKMKDSVTESVELLRQETAASIVKQQESIQVLSTKLADLFSHLSTESQITSKEILLALQSMVKDTIDSTQKVNSENNSKLQESVKTLVEILQGETANSVKKQQENINQLTEKLTNLFNLLNTKSQSAAQESFEGFKSALDASLESTLKVIMESNQKMTDAVQGLIDLMHQETADSVTHQRENMEEILNRLVNVFTELDSQLRKTAQDMEEASKVTTVNLKGTLEETMKATEKLANQLKAGADIIQDTLKSSDILVKNAGETADKFSKASGPVEKVAVEMGRQMSLVVAAENTFNQSVQKNTELLNTAVKSDLDTIQSIKAVLDRTESAWKAYEDHFKGVSGELENSFTQLEEGLTEYNSLTSTGLKDTIKQYDEHISHVLGQLQTLVDELGEPIEEVTKYLEKRSRR